MRSRVRPVFLRLLAEIQAHDPTFRATLSKGAARDFPTPRAHAWCESSTPPRIVYAPKLERADADRIEGVLRHEFGHALAFHMGEIDHTERDTDEIARRVFGRTIRYDADDVQTIGEGTSPRPLRLGL